MCASILIVDDEINLRRTLSLILQRANHQVTTAGCAGEALRYLRSSTYDLAFLDLKLPDVDGLSLLAEIRHLFPSLPVLILTAHPTPESAEEAALIGAHDYLVKPLEPAHILERVSKVLSSTE